MGEVSTYTVYTGQVYCYPSVTKCYIFSQQIYLLDFFKHLNFIFTTGCVMLDFFGWLFWLIKIFKFCLQHVQKLNAQICCLKFKGFI
jgi:hypothetical protein